MSAPLKVIHCLRAPVGGLFRHVCDLAKGQAARGLAVGVICDALKGERLYEDALSDLEHICALGVHRYPMHRQIAPSDVTTGLAIRDRCRTLNADIVHGHGAKGGAFARFASIGCPQKAFYTPHGGSLHYARSSASGFVFLNMERLLGRFTEGLIFESRYGLETYRQKVGNPSCAVRVIHNGVDEREFEPVAPSPDAADFLFIGELRTLKGVDTLLRALADVKSTQNTSAVIVGSGPDAQAFKDLVGELGLDRDVRFCDPMPARKAFALGRVLIVPSRAESFPYIVLEALAAGKATIATNVGGIPEMFGAHAGRLLTPGDSGVLADAMAATLASPQSTADVFRQLRDSVHARFTVERMVDAVSAFYTDAGDARKAAAGPISGHRSAAE